MKDELNNSKSYSSGPNPEFIKNLFTDISSTYDRANDYISLGRAKAWRKQLVHMSSAKEGSRVLDCATGTGDLAFEFKKLVGNTGHVIGCDFCTSMLELGEKKAKKLEMDVPFELADLMALNYPNDEFNITSAAYGIRNVHDPVKAISEMARVTKSGGYAMILETGKNKTPVIKSAIDWYFKNLVPLLGGWVSGNKEAYNYLNRSSLEFPCQEDFLALMNQTKAFQSTKYIGLMGGASYIYQAKVQ